MLKGSNSKINVNNIKHSRYLSFHDIRRILFSLIRAEQSRLQREGRLSAAFNIDAKIGGDPESWETLTIDEDGLGFDSLARLDLIMSVNRFFDLSSTGVEDYLLINRSLSDWVSLISKHMEIVGASARVTFSSSGSTAKQTHTTHTFEALKREVLGHLQGPLYNWKRLGRILCPLPIHHIYGFLWGIILPSLVDSEPIDLPYGLPSPVFRNVRPGDIILSTPLGWSRMVLTGLSLPDEVVGISSGGPLTSNTWKGRRQLGLARIIEVYGSSETAGLGWRDDPNEPFNLLSDIDRVDQSLIRQGSKANKMKIQDHLEWTSPDRFHVRGRKDCQVQVGGVNVSLDLVREHICKMPGIKDAAVRIEGERLKTFVVSDEINIALLETELRHHLHSLPAPARPDRFTFGQTLPQSETGKLRDW